MVRQTVWDIWIVSERGCNAQAEEGALHVLHVLLHFPAASRQSLSFPSPQSQASPQVKLTGPRSATFPSLSLPIDLSRPGTRITHCPRRSCIFATRVPRLTATALLAEIEIEKTKASKRGNGYNKETLTSAKFQMTSLAFSGRNRRISRSRLCHSHT